MVVRAKLGFGMRQNIPTLVPKTLIILTTYNIFFLSIMAATCLPSHLTDTISLVVSKRNPSSKPSPLFSLHLQSSALGRYFTVWVCIYASLRTWRYTARHRLRDLVKVEWAWSSNTEMNYRNAEFLCMTMTFSLLYHYPIFSAFS